MCPLKFILLSFFLSLYFPSQAGSRYINLIHTINHPFTVDTMDDTEELEEANLVRTTEDAVGWLIEMTGCGAQHAKIALSRTSGDISDALDVLPSVQSVSKISVFSPIPVSFQVISYDELYYWDYQTDRP